MDSMTRRLNPDAEALLRLADLLVDDVLAMSDEEILAEDAGVAGAEAEDARVREAIARALRRHGHPAHTSQSGRMTDAAELHPASSAVGTAKVLPFSHERLSLPQEGRKSTAEVGEQTVITAPVTIGPVLQCIKGLGRRPLRVARKRDIELPGSGALRVISGGKLVVEVPLRQLEDARPKERGENKARSLGVRAAAAPKAFDEASRGRADQKKFLIYRYVDVSCTIELFGDHSDVMFILMTKHDKE